MKRLIVALVAGAGLYVAGQNIATANNAQDWQVTHHNIDTLETAAMSASDHLNTWQAYAYAMQRGKVIRNRIIEDAPKAMKSLQWQISEAKAMRTTLGKAEHNNEQRLLHATALSIETACQRQLTYIADYSRAVVRNATRYQLQRIHQHHGKTLAHVADQLDAAIENLQVLREPN